MPIISRSISMGRRRGSAIWSPSALSPLEWYRMDLANITLSPNVSALADLSGNGRHAMQTTSGEQPTTGTIAGLNNAPCIVCNNTGLLLPAYSLPSPCTIMIAAEMSATPGQYGWYYCSDGVYGISSGKYGAYNCAQASQPLIGAAPAPAVILYYVDAYAEAGLRIRTGGTTYASTGILAKLSVYSLGYHPALPTQSVSCKIAEIIVAPGTLTGSPLASLSAYALARYGRSF